MTKQITWSKGRKPQFGTLGPLAPKACAGGAPNLAFKLDAGKRGGTIVYDCRDVDGCGHATSGKIKSPTWLTPLSIVSSEKPSNVRTEVQYPCFLS